MQSPAPGEPTQPAAAPPPPPSAPPPGYAPSPYGSAQPGSPPPPAAQYGGQPGWAAPQAGPAAGLAYAGFWWRVLAWFIDSILLGIVFFVLLRLFLKGIDYGNGNIVWTDGQWVLPVIYVVGILYVPVTWAALGETLGHRVLGMEIRRVDDGQRPGIGQVIVRYLGYIVSSIIIGIGFLIAAFDPRKQGLHDKMASTVVVRKTA